MGFIAGLALAAWNVFSFLNSMPKLGGLRLGLQDPAGRDDIIRIYTSAPGPWWDRIGAGLATLLVATSNAIGEVMNGEKIVRPAKPNEVTRMSSTEDASKFYGPCDSFLGGNARYVFKNAGDSNWSQYVRGRLIAEKKLGTPPRGAHIRAYAGATWMNGIGSLGDTAKGYLGAAKAGASTLIYQSVRGAAHASYLGAGPAATVFTCR